MRPATARGLSTALLLAVVVGGVLWLAEGAADGARSSSLSRGAEGWLAVRRYAEAERVPVHIDGRPLESAEPPSTPSPTSGPGTGDAAPEGTLVLAFPWQVPATDSLDAALAGHLEAGGDLLVAYSGRSPAPSERLVLQSLSLAPRRLRGEPPLDFFAWRHHVLTTWELVAEPGIALRDLRLPALDWAPEPGPDATVLYRDPEGRPLVFLADHGPGRIAVVPAAALANGRLATPGNTDLLAALLTRLAPPWRFAEYHHGFAQGPRPGAADGWVLDLVLAHLLLVYLLAVVHVGRRFGPAWRERATVTGSTADFFLGLGELHHRLGHHDDAARRLLARVEELDGEAPEGLDEPPTPGGGAEGLVALARRVARARRRGPETDDSSHRQGEP